MAGNLPTHNLKAVIHETGLTPATLRAWERRYGLFKPRRSPGGHRLYSQNEIELLKWLVARQSEGLSISQAVQLWRSEQDAPPSPAPDAQSAPAAALDMLRAAWVAACTAFDEQGAERILAQAFAIASPESVCTDLLQKGLSEIGEGWYAGKITIQQEHFASALAMRRLQALYHATPQPVRPGRILAACPPGEIHEFSLLLLSYLLRRRGWDVIYLGVNVPFEQLGATIRQVSPHLLLSIAQTLGSAADLRQMANAALDQGVVLGFGGGIFNLVPGLSTYIPGYFLGNRMEDVPQAVETFLSHPPALPPRQELSPDLRALLAEFQARSVLITASVTAALQQHGFAPAHLEEANTNFTFYLTAAIKLGDFQILDHTVAWLEGLLKNYGLPPEVARHYFAAYAQAVRQHLSGRAAPILAWLDRFSAA